MKNSNWQKVEKLVALIEQTLDNSSAKVEWNKSILDTETGMPRQVDIVIRNKLGSAEVLIAIECRDRGHPAGSPWIEELIGKKNSILAAKMIAVSTSGFSKPALLKAKKHGIETRLLDSISINDIQQWSEFQAMTFLNQIFTIQDVKFHFHPIHQTNSLENLFGPILYKQLVDNASNCNLGYAKNNGLPISLGNIVRSAMDQKDLDLPQNPDDGQVEIRNIHAKPGESDGGWLIDTPSGLLNLVTVELRVHFVFEVHVKNKHDFHAKTYSNADGDIAKAISVNCKTSIGDIGLSSVIKPDGSQVMYLQLMRNTADGPKEPPAGCPDSPS